MVGDPEKYDDVSKNKLNENKSKKVVLLSELIYLFQYLLKFDYVIYFLTGCRKCEPGQVPQQIFRYGGNKSKRRNLKRKTLKRKINKKNTYKRKTLKRKTLKRKRLH